MSIPDLESNEEELRESAAEMPTRFFRGIALKPFSFGRQAACQRLSSGTSPLEASTLLVYLCTLEREEIEKTRTPVGRKDFFLALEQWADSHKIGLMTEQGKEVSRIADEIWLELEASDSVPKKQGQSAGVSDPNADCREPQPTTRPKSRRSSRR